jgi:penicillin-binding protein A
VDKDGRTTLSFQPREQARVMSEKSAGELGEMMSNVVKEGTGTAGALSGIDVAGKTGTAEVDNGQHNQVWFIAFAPVKHPRMAIAVTLESQAHGAQGGTVAAPVAKTVLEALLR